MMVYFSIWLCCLVVYCNFWKDTTLQRGVSRVTLFVFVFWLTSRVTLGEEGLQPFARDAIVRRDKSLKLLTYCEIY